MRIFTDSIRAIVFLGTGVLIFGTSARAQSITGTVTDDQGSPLANVNVLVPGTGLHAPTGAQGKYSISRIPRGTYLLEFHIVGFAVENRAVEVGASDVTVNAVLHTTLLELPTVTVTAQPQPVDINDSPQPVSTIENREFTRDRGQSVMNSIEDLPGVSTFSRGPMSMKPVIRGLTGQRVVVAEDGMRHESQQWDDEQSPEVDPLDIDRIEVLRGPNSVLFGSDALGGVVNFIKAEPASLSNIPVRLGGLVLLNGFSNNSQGAGALTLYGSDDALEYKGQADYRNSNDMSTPRGTLPNSWERELNGAGLLGVKEEWGEVKAEYSRFGQEFHISPEPGAPQPSPAQKIMHDKVNLSYDGSVSGLRLGIHGTYQRSERAEYDDSGILDFEDSAAIRLRLRTYSLDARLEHNTIGGLTGTIGASVMTQNNETLGLEPLIPGFTQNNYAGYIFEQYRFSDVNLAGGLRFDSRKLDVDGNDDLGVDPQSKNYSALTGTAGIVWHATEEASISFNAGRGWRSPIAEELFINGADEGSIRFKVGDPDLAPEESFNLDISGRYATSRLMAEASFFRNRINRYIFLTPTGAIDPETGFEKYRQGQANATLSGMELSLQGALSDNIICHGGFDFVYARNEETDTWLPLVPANRFKAGVRLTEASAGALLNPYFSLGARIVFDQNRVDAFETPTGGYTLFNLGAGGEIALPAGRLLIDCSVDNLFDRAYFDHLSRYKPYALNPGRDFALRISVPFTLVE